MAGSCHRLAPPPTTDRGPPSRDTPRRERASAASKPCWPRRRTRGKGAAGRRPAARQASIGSSPRVEPEVVKEVSWSWLTGRAVRAEDACSRMHRSSSPPARSSPPRRTRPRVRRGTDVPIARWEYGALGAPVRTHGVTPARSRCKRRAWPADSAFSLLPPSPSAPSRAVQEARRASTVRRSRARWCDRPDMPIRAPTLDKHDVRSA